MANFHIPVLASLLSLTACVAGLSPATTYAVCQNITSDPLDGCPPGTIFVSANDTRASFTSVQAAIESLGNTTTSDTSAYILIGAGTYNEQLNVTRAAPITLLGQSALPSADELYANITTATPHTHRNLVQIHFNSANTDALYSDNAYTAVLTVAPNLNASLTGSGPTGFAEPADTPFGNRAFAAYNIDFRNEKFDYGNGPSLALGVSYANAAFYSCGFYSWQDTIYVGKLGNSYFYDVIVAGETDFLYGFGTLWIQSSTLSLRNCGGGITAWKGTNTTFLNKYGVYISQSQVLAANTTIASEIYDKCSLGRPWNPEHRSVYQQTYLDGSILPAGYTAWSGQPNGNIGPNTTMAVWNVSGPGWNSSAEISGNITEIWTQEQVKPYSAPVQVFMTEYGEQPNVGWIDVSVLYQG